MNFGCMSSKITGSQQVEKGEGNLQKYVSILLDFLISSLEDHFGEHNVIFIDEKMSCDYVPDSEKIAPKIEQPICSPPINRIENMWYILNKKLVFN